MSKLVQVQTKLLKIIEINPREARHKMLNHYNNLFRDRRVELYNPLLTR